MTWEEIQVNLGRRSQRCFQAKSCARKSAPLWVISGRAMSALPPEADMTELLESNIGESKRYTRNRHKCALHLSRALLCKQRGVLLAQFTLEQFAARVPRQGFSEHNVHRHLERRQMFGAMSINCFL